MCSTPLKTLNIDCQESGSQEKKAKFIILKKPSAVIVSRDLSLLFILIESKRLSSGGRAAAQPVGRRRRRLRVEHAGRQEPIGLILVFLFLFFLATELEFNVDASPAVQVTTE